MTKDLITLKRQFLEYCELEKGQSELTISNYDRYLSRFLEWLLEYKKSNIEKEEKKENNESFKIEIFPEDIEIEGVRQYRLFVNRGLENHKEIKTTTQNYHIIALRAFLRYLSFLGIKSLSPEKISIAKTGDREITFLEKNEFLEILEKPDLSSKNGLRDRAIIEMLFSTGMRVSECVSLNLGNINFERGEIAVLGKGRKLRVVFLSPEAKDILWQYISNRGVDIESSQKNETVPLFVSQKKTRMTSRTVERIVEKYRKKAGIVKKVSPHTLRHSFATDLLSAGADIRSVQSLLGHSSITTTQIYTHVTDQHLREVHHKYHNRKPEEACDDDCVN